MKLSRKIAGFALSFALLASSASVVFAAPNDDVIKALKDAKLPKTYIVQAENYLKNNEVAPEAAASVKENIEKAEDIMKAAGTKDASKLSEADVQKVMTAVKEAGKAMDLEINVKKNDNGSVAIVAKDSKGELVADFSTAEVKQTGVNNTLLVFGAGLFMMSVAGFVVARKKITE